MSNSAHFFEARKIFHAMLLESTLTTNSAGVVSNADSSNNSSKKIAKGIADLLNAETIGERIVARPRAINSKAFVPISCKIPSCNCITYAPVNGTFIR